MNKIVDLNKCYIRLTKGENDWKGAASVIPTHTTLIKLKKKWL